MLQLSALTVAGGMGWPMGRLQSAEPARKSAPSLRKASKDAPDVLPFVEGSFTIAALPDTQHYCRAFPKHYYNQTDWIAANRDRYDIRFVIHLGDITNNNNRPQWKVAQKAMRSLRDVVSYSLIPGNHDYHDHTGKYTTRDTLLNDYFSPNDLQTQPTLGGLMEPGRLENGYHVFEANGQEFLVLALEYGPRDNVLQWANRVAEKHPNHRAILTTHAYLYHDNTRYDFNKYGSRQRWSPRRSELVNLPGGVNDGQQLWDKLVSRHKNFFITLNGHVLEAGLGKLTSRGAGGDVHQMLVNYQMKREGGEGYLRLLEFLPDGKAVQVRCYSPSTDAYKTDSQNQFVLSLKPNWTS